MNANTYAAAAATPSAEELELFRQFQAFQNLRRAAMTKVATEAAAAPPPPADRFPPRRINWEGVATMCLKYIFGDTHRHTDDHLLWRTIYEFDPEHFSLIGEPHSAGPGAPLYISVRYIGVSTKGAEYTKANFHIYGTIDGIRFTATHADWCARYKGERTEMRRLWTKRTAETTEADEWKSVGSG